MNCSPYNCWPCRCSPIMWPPANCYPPTKFVPVTNCYSVRICSFLCFLPRWCFFFLWSPPSVRITFCYPETNLSLPKFIWLKSLSKMLVSLMLVEYSSVLIGAAFSVKTTVSWVVWVTIGCSTNSWTMGALVSSTILLSCLSWMMGICFSWIIYFSDSWIIGTCFSVINYSWITGWMCSCRIF